MRLLPVAPRGALRARGRAATSRWKVEHSALPPSLRSATLPESGERALRDKWPGFGSARLARFPASRGLRPDAREKVLSRLRIGEGFPAQGRSANLGFAPYSSAASQSPGGVR